MWVSKRILTGGEEEDHALDRKMPEFIYGVGGTIGLQSLLSALHPGEPMGCWRLNFSWPHRQVPSPLEPQDKEFKRGTLQWLWHTLQNREHLSLSQSHPRSKKIEQHSEPTLMKPYKKRKPPVTYLQDIS